MDIAIFAVLLFVALSQLAIMCVWWRDRKAHKAGGTVGKKIFIDTSVLMDGRILAMAKTGFITNEVVIPRSVVLELQTLADYGDNQKRARARYGLDVVRNLQQLEGLEVSILADEADNGVDNHLLALAKQYQGYLCTIDYNLNKVAVVEQIAVLNINELARSLRMAQLPGDQLDLALQTKGQSNDQGVGHLSDGTMVVVEKAAKYIGQTKRVEVIRSLQTEAGKMVFAKIIAQQDKKVQAEADTTQITTHASRQKKPTTAQSKRKLAKAKTSGRKSVSTTKTQKKSQTGNTKTVAAHISPKQSGGSSSVVYKVARTRTSQATSPVQKKTNAKNSNKRGSSVVAKTEARKKNTQPDTKKRSNSRRKKTNEDRLVELANK